jgi:hypothetical protein
VKRSSLVVLALALCTVGAGAFYLLRPRYDLPVDPLAAVPADAYGVLRIKVARVLGSEAYKRLVVERGEAEGIERITKLCGFNPLEGIQELVVFARPRAGGGMPRFAFTARGKLDHDALVECVKKFAGASGGDASGLKRDDIEGIPAVTSRHGTSRAAFLGSDGIVGGDAESVVASINTVLGKAPSLAGDTVLRGLYTQFDPGTDIAGVARMPAEARTLLQALAQGLFGSQLAILTDAKAAAGSLSFADAKIMGGGLVVAASPEHAVASVMLVRNFVDRLLGIPGVALTPAAGVLRGIQTDVEGDRATISGQIKVSTAVALLELLPALEQLRGVLSGGDRAEGAAPGAASAPGASAPAEAREQTDKKPAAGARTAQGSVPANAPVPTVEPLRPRR